MEAVHGATPAATMTFAKATAPLPNACDGCRCADHFETLILVEQFRQRPAPRDSSGKNEDAYQAAVRSRRSRTATCLTDVWPPR